MALPAEDRQLLREVLAWARTHGWTSQRWLAGRRWDDADGNREVVWYYDADDRDAWTLVANEPTTLELVAPTVRQAVDVLAALGVLPFEFSSAYRGLSVEWALRSRSTPSRIFSRSDSEDFPRAMWGYGSRRRFNDVVRRAVGPWEVAR